MGRGVRCKGKQGVSTILTARMECGRADYADARGVCQAQSAVEHLYSEPQIYENTLILVK